MYYIVTSAILNSVRWYITQNKIIIKTIVTVNFKLLGILGFALISDDKHNRIQ